MRDEIAPDWALDLDRLKQSITAGTWAIIINIPLQPVRHGDSLEATLLVAEQYNIFIIANERKANQRLGWQRQLKLSLLRTRLRPEIPQR